MKSTCAASSARSETVRTTANGRPKSKHTWARAAPSISTASASGRRRRSASLSPAVATKRSPLSTRPACTCGASMPKAASRRGVEALAGVAAAALQGGVEHGAGGLGQRRRHRRIGGEAVGAVERHLVPREERRGVHVVLQQRLGDDHVADPRPFVQAAGGAGEDRPLDAELAGEQRRRRRRRDLADAGEHRDHLVAVEMADPELAAGAQQRRLVGHAGRAARRAPDAWR